MNKIKKTIIITVTLIITLGVLASLQGVAAVPNQNAPVGGVFVRNLGGEPPTLHPISSTDLYSRIIQLLVLDTLLIRNPETYEWMPRLAEKWETSKDGKVITYYLNKSAQFHDGTPVTSEDVKFSFEAIFNPAYEAAHIRPYYEGIEKVEAVDAHTVKFFLKNTYFQNFIQASELFVLPKHIYGDVEKSKKMTRTLVGSGPYKLEKFDVGQKIILKRFSEWFAHNTPTYKGAYNFDQLVFKFVKEDAVGFEMVKKGDLDFEGLTSEYYEKKYKEDAQRPNSPWDKTVIAVKTENSDPKRGYGFVGWNMRNEIFQDKNVRLALAHLMNREEMNKKFRFGNSVLATGPQNIFSEYASPKVKPILFNPKKAKELLSKAGWSDSNNDGVLDKKNNGTLVSLKFSLIHPNKDSEKYWTMYKEDLKKSGVDMEIKYLEWNSFLKVLDDGKFEAVALAWTNEYDWDPKQIWHSSSAVPGGSNFIGYKNKKIDDLMDKARMETNSKKRLQMLRTVYEEIAADAPYVFLFNEKYAMYAVNTKIGRPKDTFKYEVGLNYWWSTEAKAKP